MNSRRIFSSAALVVGAMVFSIGLQAFAFSQPTASPPNSDADAPLNVGSTGQTKVGGLTLGTGSVTEALHVTNGRIQVGAGTPDSGAGLAIFVKKFQLTDGTQGAGKVLTSDANGLASWSNTSCGSGSVNCTKFPNGALMQWGKETATTDGQVGSQFLHTVSLPYSMASGYTVSVTSGNASQNCVPGVYSTSAASFVFITDGSCTNLVYHWTVVGFGL